MTNIENNEINEQAEPMATEPAAPSTRQRSTLLVMAAIVIVLDQLTKRLVEATLPLYQSWAPIPELAPFFQISHVSNTGTAFGLFPAGSSIFAWAAIIVSIAIVVYNYTLPPTQVRLRLALGLQLGGALGNLTDRFRIGHVTDFLDFGPWPVFNLADTSIVAGALLLAWLLWQEERRVASTPEPIAKADNSGFEAREMIHESSVVDEWSAN